MISDFEKETYMEMVSLCVNYPDSFEFKDCVVNGKKLRTFSYKKPTPSYKTFSVSPLGVEMRGITFEIIDEEPQRIACFPLPKIYNVFENPLTMDVTPDKIKSATLKFDGSMISTFHVDFELHLKTKKGFNNIMTDIAKEILSRPEEKEFFRDLQDITFNKYTVNMELVGKDNLHVVSYEKNDLKIINIRDNDTGKICPRSDFNFCMGLKKHWIEYEDVEHIRKVFDSIVDMPEIEGYVFELFDGRTVKYKTRWFCERFRLRENANNEKYIIQAIFDGTIDDMKSHFHCQKELYKKIESIHEIFVLRYNHMVRSVESFYHKHKHLTKHEYYLKTKELNHPFGLLCLGFRDHEDHITMFKKYVFKNVGYFTGKQNV